jgi:hypothetical protein
MSQKSSDVFYKNAGLCKELPFVQIYQLILFSSSFRAWTRSFACS